MLWLEDTLGKRTKESGHLFRASVIGVMYMSFHKSKEKASEFWEKVKVGDGSPKSAERKLERYLRDNTVRSSTGKAVGPREMFVKCIHAWNAWRKGAATDLKYHASADIPELA